MNRILLLATLLLCTSSQASAVTTTSGVGMCVCRTGDIQFANGPERCLLTRKCLHFGDAGNPLCYRTQKTETDENGIQTVHFLDGYWGPWHEVCDKDDEKSLVEELFR